jgi:hypothetical protein
VERRHLHRLPAEPHQVALGEQRLVDDDQSCRSSAHRTSANRTGRDQPARDGRQPDPGTAGCTLVGAAPVAQRIEHLTTDDIGGVVPLDGVKVNMLTTCRNPVEM